MRRRTKLAALLTAGMLSLAATACGGDDGDSADDNGDGDAAGSGIKVGMAYDVGGRGDQSFNDSAAAGLDQAVEEFGMDPQESEAEDGEAETAREERLRTFADAGYNPIIAVGFAYSASVAKVAPEYPDVNFAIIDDESRGRRQHRQPGLRRGAGLVPGRRGCRAQDRGRPHRLRRWRRDPADPEVRGRLHRGRRGGQPRHPGRRHLPDPGPRLLRLRRPGQGQDGRPGHVRRRRRHRLPRRWWLRRWCLRGRLRGGRGQLGDRCRLRPVRDGRPVGPGRHPDVDAQERERRGLRLPQGRQRR